MTPRRKHIVRAAALLALLVGGGVAAGAAGDVTAAFDPPSPNGDNGFYTSAVSATFSGKDPSDTCDPSSWSYNGPGSTDVQVPDVTCTSAADGSTYTGSFPSLKYDDSAPFMTNLPSDFVIKAGHASQAVISYAPPDGNDDVDSSPSVHCDPAPGDSKPVGKYTIGCTVRDAAGNSRTNDTVATVTVDGGPTIVPQGNLTAEAGPGGPAKVSYTIEASDPEDGPFPPSSIDCGPWSPNGDTFPLGTRTVTCRVTDSQGQSDSESFEVKVEDTTPPKFTVKPQDVTVQAADLKTGTPTSNGCIQKFLNSPRADDVVDGARAATPLDVPSRFPLGDTTITFRTTDSHGNRDTAEATVTVKRGPQGPCTVDASPPRAPRHLIVRAASHRVVLHWRCPATPDFDHVEIFRSRATATGQTEPTLVYSGRLSSFTDVHVVNGILYRYDVVCLDHAGNESPATSIFATPHVIVLLQPSDGARISTRRPLLKWVRRSRARFYNVQLYRVSGGKQTKILSVWPRHRYYRVHRVWRYAHHRRSLVRGHTYRWYVWAWFGPTSTGHFGPTMGPNAFFVRRR